MTWRGYKQKQTKSYKPAGIFKKKKQSRKNMKIWATYRSSGKIKKENHEIITWENTNEKNRRICKEMGEEEKKKRIGEEMHKRKRELKERCVNKKPGKVD